MKALFMAILCTVGWSHPASISNISHETTTITGVEVESTYGDLEVVFEDVAEVTFEHNISVNGQVATDQLQVRKKVRNGMLHLDFDLDFDDFVEMVTIKTQDCEVIRIPAEDFEDEKEKWSGWNQMNFGYDVDGTIKIRVPRSYESRIYSTYGTIDLIFDQSPRGVQLEAKSTYGDIDLAIPTSTDASLKMTTSYGVIYSDHDIEIPRKKRNSEYPFGSQIKGSLGSGNGNGTIVLEATYQNIYLRKV